MTVLPRELTPFVFVSRRVDAIWGFEAFLLTLEVRFDRNIRIRFFVVIGAKLVPAFLALIKGNEFIAAFFVALFWSRSGSSGGNIFSGRGGTGCGSSSGSSIARGSDC